MRPGPLSEDQSARRVPRRRDWGLPTRSNCLAGPDFSASYNRHSWSVASIDEACGGLTSASLSHGDVNGPEDRIGTGLRR
jgi:hypothetical protein